MKNALFDELKDLKKSMAYDEKIENEKKITKIRAEKEKKLKDEFLDFIKDSRTTKIDN